MKINDKSLSSYAISREGIHKEGHLQKKGEVNHSYKKRWFVLKGNMLFYFEKQYDKQPLGMIVLENCSVEVSDTERFSFCIRYQALGTVGASRTYILCAESEDDMQQWMKAISSASYCYTSMVAAEFEKMLEGLKSIVKKFDEPAIVEDDSRTKRTLLSLVETDNGTIRRSYEDKVDSNKPITRTLTGPNKYNGSSLLDFDIICKAKPPLDMYTVTNVNTSKSKFKTLQRSKSSENLMKITSVSSNPKRIQTLKRPQTYGAATDTANDVAITTIFNNNNDNRPLVAYELEKTTFEIMHTSFGAAIWTRIGETL